MKLSSILFMDDYEMKPEPDQELYYTKGEPFVEIHRNGELEELVNISIIRSMQIDKQPIPITIAVTTAE